MNMKVGGLEVVRARAHMWPMACWGWVLVFAFVGEAIAGGWGLTNTGGVEEVEAPVAEVVEGWETPDFETGWGVIKGYLAGWTAPGDVRIGDW